MSIDTAAKKLRDHMAGANADEIAVEAAQRVAASLAATAAEFAELEGHEPTDDWPLDADFWSIGYTAQNFQMSPANVRGLAKLAGVKFVAAFNGVPHFNGLGIITMRKKLVELRAQHAQRSHAH